MIYAILIITNILTLTACVLAVQRSLVLIEKIDERIAVGVRLGGMGVAIGSLVGKELSELF